MLVVEKVDNPSRLRRFLQLPEQVYRGNSHWVPHLTLQTLLLMGSPWDRSRGFWLAMEDGRTVARIGAKIHRHQDREAVHFGFFECLKGYPEAASRLVDQAHNLAPYLDLVGPYHFRMEDPYTGLQVEGFDHPSCFWASYNPPYYADYLEAAGLSKVMDLWTYRGDWEHARLGPVFRRAEKAEQQGVRVRSLDTRRRWSEIKRVAEVMNRSLKDNWGFEEFSGTQVMELYLLSFLFLDPGWLFLAEYEEQTMGAAIVLPDYNPWIKESGGRLTPALLRRLLSQKSEISHVRAWGLGVLPEIRSLHAAPAIIARAIERGERLGVQSMDVTWVLEENRPMNAMLKAMGAYRSKVHRVFKRDARC